METILPSVDIIDKEFIENFIHTLLYNEGDETLHSLIQKVNETDFWDIALIGNDEEFNNYRTILKTATKMRLEGKPLSVIRERLYSNKSLANIIDKSKEKFVDYDYETVEEINWKIKMFFLYHFMVKFNQTNIPKAREKNVMNDESFTSLMGDIEKLYDSVTFDKIATEVTYNDDSRIDERINNIKKIFDNSSTSKKIYHCGIDLLDACFRYNGFESGDIYMFQGSYGIGKTRFVVNLGHAFFLNGYNVYHVTIENEKEDVESYYDSVFLGKPPEEIYYNLLRTKGEEVAEKELKDMIYNLREKIGERDNVLEIKKFSPWKVNARLIETYLKRRIASGGAPRPNILIIDHIDIMSANNGWVSDMFHRGELITGELKELSEKYNACTIFPSQLNREGVKMNKSNNQTVGGEYGSRSMAKNELVSFVGTILQTQDESTKKLARMYIDKNRKGLDKITIPFKWDKGSIQIEQITDDYTLGEFDGNVRKSVSLLKQRSEGKIATLSEFHSKYNSVDSSDESTQEIPENYDDVFEGGNKEIPEKIKDSKDKEPIDEFNF